MNLIALSWGLDGSYLDESNDKRDGAEANDGAGLKEAVGGKLLSNPTEITQP